MATLSKTPQGQWRARVRRTGWPPTSKVFRTRRDAADWARSIEDEMVRGLYLRRTEAERLTVRSLIRRRRAADLPALHRRRTSRHGPLLQAS